MYVCCNIAWNISCSYDLFRKARWPTINKLKRNFQLNAEFEPLLTANKRKLRRGFRFHYRQKNSRIQFAQKIFDFVCRINYKPSHDIIIVTNRKTLFDSAQWLASALSATPLLRFYASNQCNWKSEKEKWLSISNVFKILISIKNCSNFQHYTFHDS